MASSTSSLSSSSPSSATRLKVVFNEALTPQTVIGSNSSSRINYLDSLGSGDPSVTGDQEYPDLSGDPIEETQGGDYSYRTIVNVDESNVASGAHDDNLQERLESRQRRVIFIVAFHLILLSAVDFSLQILLVHCGTYCPDTDLLHHIELGIVILFPLTALVFLRLVVCCKSSGTSFILMSLYTVSFALFFYGACDLVFGNTRAHRDIALILFTLTLSFILFSLYVYSKNSTKCFYLALGILIITALLTLGIVLAFPSTLDQLPHKLEGILTQNKESSTTSVLVLYALAFVYALAAVSLTTLMFTVLRGIIFKRNHSSLDGGACSTAVEVLLRTEMFFIVWPFEILSRLARRCSWSQG